MATWTGWASEFLQAAGLPDSAGNLRWLDDWSTNSISDCRNNPVDLSRTEPGTSACQKLTASRTAQNYQSHTQAAGAFSRQIRSGNFPNLLKAMQSGDYPTPSQLGDVETDLQIWGSRNFVKFIEDTFGIAPGGGGIGPPAGFAPHTHRAFHDLKFALNTLARDTHNSGKQVRSALATIRHRQRVGG